jgi:hypothetical protein
LCVIEYHIAILYDVLAAHLRNHVSIWGLACHDHHHFPLLVGSFFSNGREFANSEAAGPRATSKVAALQIALAHKRRDSLTKPIHQQNFLCVIESRIENRYDVFAAYHNDFTFRLGFLVVV